MGFLFNYDYTFCYNEKCTKTNCKRHMKNAPEGIPLSWSLFNEKNHRKCDEYLKGGARNKKN